MLKRLPFIIFVLLLIGGLVFLSWNIIHSVRVEYSKTQVDSYIETFEISQMAYAEEAFSETTSYPVYRAGIRNKNTAVTIRITNEEFAKYTVSDIVHVNVTVYEYSDGHQSKEYKIIGLAETGE